MRENAEWQACPGHLLAWGFKPFPHHTMQQNRNRCSTLRVARQMPQGVPNTTSYQWRAYVLCWWDLKKTADASDQEKLCLLLAWGSYCANGHLEATLYFWWPRAQVVHCIVTAGTWLKSRYCHGSHNWLLLHQYFPSALAQHHSLLQKSDWKQIMATERIILFLVVVHLLACHHTPVFERASPKPLRIWQSTVNKSEQIEKEKIMLVLIELQLCFLASD